MKPQDLKIEQLEAIPLEEYDGLGCHRETEDAICADGALKMGGCYNDLSECHGCILDDPYSVLARIKELKTLSSNGK
jgi:hypothetical protein